MTRLDFIEANRHEIAGQVMDALTCGLTGAPLAMFLRDMMRKIDDRLGRMYDLLQARDGPSTPTDIANGIELKRLEQRKKAP